MIDDSLLVDRTDSGVAILTLNRPDARNAIDLACMRAFAAAIDELALDEGLAAVVVTGAGDESFCSGADLHELSSFTTQEQARYFVTLMGDALLNLERLPVPVIAAINGYALGGGAEIALACDMRIADERTRMGFVHARLAVTPGWGAGQRLLRLVGYSHAMQILLRARVIYAPELDALGMVNKIVPAGESLRHALIAAEHIAAMPPEVPRSIKALLQAGINEDYEQALKTERALFPPLWASEPHQRAVDEFVARHNKNNGRKR